MGEVSPAVKLLAVVVMLALASVFAWQRYLSPEAAARRRDGALYRQLTQYPGAVQLERSTVYTAGDSCTRLLFLRSCGSYALHVSYALPAGIGVDQAMTFYLANLPAGWRQAGDDACIFPAGPPPGAHPLPPTPPMKLVQPEGQLLLENHSRKRVSVVFDPPIVAMRPGTYGCVPA